MKRERERETKDTRPTKLSLSFGKEREILSKSSCKKSPPKNLVLSGKTIKKIQPIKFQLIIPLQRDHIGGTLYTKKPHKELVLSPSFSSSSSSFSPRKENRPYLLLFLCFHKIHSRCKNINRSDRRVRRLLLSSFWRMKGDRRRRE